MNPPPTSWEIVWDPKYKGRVIMADTDQELIQFAVALGAKDPFNLTKDEMAHIKQRLIDLRSNLKAYFATFEDSVQYVEDGDVDLLIQGDEYRVKLLHDRGYDNWALTVPKEGALGWTDVYTVSSGTGDEDLAYAWINFILEKRISDQLSERLAYPNAVTKSSDIDYADKLTWLKAVEDFTWRTNVWNEIKAAPVQ